MRRLLLAVAFCGLVFASEQTVRAGLVMDFTGGTAQPATADAIGGWEFQVIGGTSITVNAMGLWDEGSKALVNSHAVGLWDSSRHLLASTTVTSASAPVASNSGPGQWLFNSIAPVVLGPGNYVIGAAYVNNDADLVRLSASATTISGVNYVAARTAISSVLTFPDSVQDAYRDGVFGPNLQIQDPTTQPVPEPATLGMAGTAALVGLVIARRRVKA